MLTVSGETVSLSGHAPSTYRAGDKVTLVVRPEHVTLSRAQGVVSPRWSGVVDTRQFLGESVEYVVLLDDESTRLQVRTDAMAEFAPGDAVCVEPRMEHCRILADTEASR